jgi:hypothetical protein
MPLMPLITVLAMLATAFLPATQPPSAASDTCIAGVKQVSRSNFSSRNDRHEVEWRAEGCDVTIKFDGEPRFSDDFKTLVSLAARDRFDVDERNPRVNRAVEIRAGASGLDYRYSVNGQQRPFDAEGRRWLDAVIHEFFVRTAYRSKERVAYLFTNGGANRVLDEIDQMPTTYPQHAYMTALIDQAPPSAATVGRMLQRARGWSSDYYKSGLLTRLVEAARLPESGMWDALWAVALTIDSDYYSSSVVRAYIQAKAPLNAAQFEEVLRKIDSDYYRAGLVDVGEKKVGNDFGPIALAAARQTKSAYYRSQILTNYLQHANPDPALLVDVIKLAGELDSDYYCSQVLQHVASQRRLEGAARDAYVTAAEAIGSRHYRQRALAAIERDSR